VNAFPLPDNWTSLGVAAAIVVHKAAVMADEAMFDDLGKCLDANGVRHTQANEASAFIAMVDAPCVSGADVAVKVDYLINGTVGNRSSLIDYLTEYGDGGDDLTRRLLKSFARPQQNPDAKLIALSAEFRKAWAAERAAFEAADLASIGNSTPEIDSAHDRCAAVSEQMLGCRPVTVEGVKAMAMIWGWLHYQSSRSGDYDGGEAGNHVDERASHAVMTFLLKDVAA